MRELVEVVRYQSQVVRDGCGRDHEIVRTDGCAHTGELLPNRSIGLGTGIVEGSRHEELEKIVANVKTASEDPNTVVAHVRMGEGSLGKILMDQELYDEALKSVKLLTRSLEDYREAAPITAFTGVLFSAF